MSDVRKTRNMSVFETVNPEQRLNTETYRAEQAKDPKQYYEPLPLAILTVGICLSVFLVSLDRTIVATVNGREASY